MFPSSAVTGLIDFASTTKGCDADTVVNIRFGILNLENKPGSCEVAKELQGRTGKKTAP